MNTDTNVIWTPGMNLETLEQHVIEVAYKFYRENKTLTASALGISTRTMTNKLEHYESLETQRLENERAQKKANQEFLNRCRGKDPSFQIEQDAHVESAVKDSTQLAVPMSKREEIQDVLPDQVTNFGAKEAAREFKQQMMAPDLVFVTEANRERMENISDQQSPN